MLQFSSAAQIEIDRTQEFFCAENLFRSLNDLLRVKEIPVKGLLICALASSFSPGLRTPLQPGIRRQRPGRKSGKPMKNRAFCECR